MPGVRDIKIRFSGDSSGLAKAAADGEQSMGRFSEKTQKWAKIGLAATAAIGAAAVAGARSAINAASDTAESASKVGTLLGDFSGAANDFAKTSASAYGISKREALGAVGAMAAVDRAMGTNQEEASKLAVEYTKLSADLASFNNASSAEVQEALTASLSGEYEMLKKYGIVVNDTTLAAEAQRIGMEKQGATWTSAQKRQLSYNIIMDATKSAQGDFARTSDGLANQQKILQARMDDLQANIGAKLLPVMIQVMGAFQGVMTWVQNNQTQAKILAGVIAGLVIVIGTVSAAITAWSAITRTATAIQAAWNVVMAANPLVLVTIAVIALVAAIVLIATKTTWFQQIWKAAMGAVQGAISGAFNWIKSNWPLILGVLTGPVGLAVVAIVKHKDRILDLIGQIPETAKRLFSGLSATLTAPFSAAVGAIRSAWNNTLGGKGWDGVSIPLGPDVPGFRIPMLARGGRARGGMAHIVGEEGPELFVPGVTGRVVPNGEFGAGDTTVEIYGNGDPSVLEALIDRVVVKRNRTTKLAVQAGSRRAFA